MAQKAKVRIELETKMTGIERMSRQIGKFTKQFDQMGKSFKTGLGVEAFRMATNGFWRLTNAIKSAVASGIQFNAMVETSQISLGAVLRSTLPDKFYTFNSAMERSTELFEQLRRGAVDAGISIAAAGEVFAATSGMMTKSNIPLEKQAKLMTLIMRATKTMGLTSQIQLFQEARAMFAAENLRGALVAQASGMTITGLKGAASTGTLDQYIEQKLGGFLESASALSSSFQVIVSKFSMASQELFATGILPFMNDLKGAFADMTTVIRASIPWVGAAAKIARRVGKFAIGPGVGMYQQFNDMRADGTIDRVGRAVGGIRDAKGSRRWYAENLMKRGFSEEAAYQEYDRFNFLRDLKSDPVFMSAFGGVDDSTSLKDLQEAYKWYEYMSEGPLDSEEKKSKKSVWSSIAKSMFSSTSVSGMAQRGLYGSQGVANYYQNSLDIQRGMLNQLKDIAKSSKELVERV